MKIQFIETKSEIKYYKDGKEIFPSPDQKLMHSIYGNGGAIDSYENIVSENITISIDKKLSKKAFCDIFDILQKNIYTDKIVISF